MGSAPSDPKLARSDSGPTSPRVSGLGTAPGSASEERTPLTVSRDGNRRFPYHQTMTEAVRLLHLSDIHFRSSLSNTPHDLDRDIRDQLLTDAARLVSLVGPVSVIVVTGDIAFAGKPEEYDIAATWLRDLSDAIGVAEQQVWPTPGNHDVDRDVIRGSKFLRTVHRDLRRCAPEELDEELRAYFSDVASRNVLLAPLRAYNDFASRFGCGFTADVPFWDHQLTMNDQSSLVVRGLNSVLISDESDDIDANKLVLGTAQVQCRERPGTAYVTLCHHPPEWLRDRDGVHDYLNARVRVQLFGHKHRQAVEEINGCLRVTAGAMQPNRREPDWIPRYSLLELSVETTEARSLRVALHSRRWNDSGKTFEPHFHPTGRSHRIYKLPLPPWSAPEPSAPTAVPFDLAGTIDPVVRLEAPEMNSARRLAYRFLTLPYHERIATAIELQLFEESDQGLSDQRLFAEFFRRARERNSLGELWDAVERRHGNEATENPFR